MLNVDRLKLFPNQETGGDPTECTALTVTDICANIIGLAFDPDFQYASTFKLLGQLPSTNGTDPLAAMQTAIYYGLLPASDETFTALLNGELYAANIANYTPYDLQAALVHTMAGIEPIGVNFSEVCAYILGTKWGVSVPMTWHASFLTAPNGMLQMPIPGEPTSNHNIAVYGVDDNNNLIFKPWLGPKWGNGGYGSMSRAVFNAVATNGIAFDPDGSRWMSILGLILTRFPGILLTPKLINANAN